MFPVSLEIKSDNDLAILQVALRQYRQFACEYYTDIGPARKSTLAAIDRMMTELKAHQENYDRLMRADHDS